MKLDPGMHIGMHLVFFGKAGVTTTRQHPLLPLLCAAIFFHAGNPVQPLFTNACTSAHGHRAEDALSCPFEDVPTFEPREYVVSAPPPPRTPLCETGLRVVLGNIL
jgi:hypothetical protein